MKKIFLLLVMTLSLCLGFSSLKPVFASEVTTEDKSETDNSSINDFSVTMNSDGTISTSIDDGDATTTWSTIFNKSKVFLIGFTGFATLAFGFFFSKNLMGLGASSNNPSARREALSGIFWTGIATAGCGSLTLIIGLFWNALK